MPELEERIAVLEANQQHMRDKLIEMSGKVDEMHELLLQAKGARWAILGAAGAAGFLAGKVGGDVRPSARMMEVAHAAHRS